MIFKLTKHRWPKALILLCLLFISQISVSSECTVIHAYLEGSSFLCGDSSVGLCSEGKITGSFIRGTKHAIYTAAAPSAGLWTEAMTSTSYSADAVFTTTHGELHLNQLGVIDTERQVFTELNRIVGGTGRFTQASGELFISGTVDSTNIVTNFESEVTGKVCLSDK